MTNKVTAIKVWGIPLQITSQSSYLARCTHEQHFCALLQLQLHLTINIAYIALHIL